MSTPSYLTSIHSIIDKAKPLGHRQLANGTQLIGNIPHVAPEAKLHVVFPGLAEKDIDYIQDKLGITFPGSLEVFYFYHNGISLFRAACPYMV